MSVSVIEGPNLPPFPEPGVFGARAAAAAHPGAAPAARPAFPVELWHVLDTGAALAVLFATWVLTNVGQMPGGLDDFLGHRVSMRNALLVGGFTILWPRLLGLAGLYQQAPLSWKTVAWRAFVACTLGSMVAFVFPLASISGSFRLEGVLYFWAGSTLATVAIRVPAWTLSAAAARSREARRVIILGSGPRALKAAREIQAAPGGTYELMGFVDSNDHALSGSLNAPKLGTLEELEDILMHQVVDEVLIALPIKSCYTEIQHAIRICERTGTESKYMADLFQCSLARPRYEAGARLPVLTMKVFHDDYRLSVKRAIDVAGALAGLVVLAPLMLVIALAVKLTSPGPVLFAQERYGLNKRRFRMYKFRTMVPDAEALQVRLEEHNEAVGPVFKIRNDPRVTPVGRVLRKLSLDELPQLWNVLMGHMSLVGPRPLPVRDVQLFDQSWFMRRFSVPPGLTCLWQIGGRSDLGFDDWVALDLKYIDEWSLGLDLKILARTVPAVLRGEGAA